MKLYDTSSLLLLREIPEGAAISSITLEELENIKTNRNKDEQIKFQVRRILNFLWENPEKYEAIIYSPTFLEKLTVLPENVNNDIKILSCAVADERIDTLVTNDLSLAVTAREFGIKVERTSDEEDPYCGYIEKELTDEELNILYSDLHTNSQNLLQNEYLIIKDAENDNSQVLCWEGDKYRKLSYSNISCKYMDVAPKDIYQRLAIDALLHNSFVMLTGQAGTAKTLISLSYALQEVFSGRRKKLIIFSNPAPAKGAQEIGFLKGTKNEKLLSSSIGSILASKIGSIEEVEKNIDIGKIELLTFADLRGYDTSGMNAIVLITEAQNLSTYLLQLAIQRIGEDCQLIVEGDNAQVDNNIYEGANNGMRRVSEVFRGFKDYAQVNLKNIYRSDIAKKAMEM